VELTGRRDFIQPSPHQSSYETSCRRSGPTTDCVKTLAGGSAYKNQRFSTLNREEDR
jgi:hypothetical protein